MTTEKQVQANRRNAKLSTGPRNSQGKAIVAKNALKHGLLSQEVYVEEESKQAFEELKSSLYFQFEPQGQLEMFLVDKIVSLAWRLGLLTRIEAQIFQHEDSLWDRDPEIKRAFLCSNSRKALCLLNRYETSIERKFYQALGELKREQSIRKFSQATLPVEVIMKDEIGNGFVS